MNPLELTAAVVSIAGFLAIASSAVNLIIFFMNRGKVDAKAENASTQAIAVSAKVDLLASDLARYKESVAQTYMTASGVTQIENRLTSEMHRFTDEVRTAMNDMRQSFDRMTEQMISALAQSAAKPKR